MKNCLTLLLSALLGACSFAQTPTPLLTVFATGFTRPCDIAQCGDDRLFVVEQGGKIWILDKDGDKLPTPFLNIDPSVGSGGNEQGLLGLAFHPGYPTTPHFYVNYTDNNGDTKVSRFSVSATDPNLADANSELVLLTADQPFSNHNGGCVKFGPDGYLYIGLGDGGSGGDPQANGQKRTTFLAKMLRIDVDGGSPYAVPATNPFVNDPNTLPEIWALGVRNPWRFSFDRLTGDLWIGDVGQDSWEEIDFQPANSPGGQNYGWRCYEGNHVFNSSNCLGSTEMTFPVAEYANSGALGCSVTGGFAYRGFNYPNLYGRYLYSDYCTGKLWSLLPGTSGWNNEQIADFVNNQVVSFGENKNGELFVAGNGGTIWRLEDSSEFWQYTVNALPSPCAGTTDGIIQVVFSSNVPTPTVTWSDGFEGTVRSGLSDGTYSFTFNGPNGSVVAETVTLAPSISLSGSVTNVTCAGDSDGSIDLTVNGTTAPPTSVTWNDGSTELDRTGLPGGTYTVSVMSAEGCVLVETFVVVESFPNDFPFIGLSMDSVLQVDDVWGNYQWLLNGVPIPGANSNVYVATVNGVYSVEAGSDCPLISNTITVNLTDANFIPQLQGVTVSPNPFTQALLLSVKSSEPVALDLRLTDLQGRSLLTDRLSVNGTATRSFDLSGIPAGTYLLVLKNGEGEWVEKVVKL